MPTQTVENEVAGIELREFADVATKPSGCAGLGVLAQRQREVGQLLLEGFVSERAVDLST